MVATEFEFIVFENCLECVMRSSVLIIFVSNKMILVPINQDTIIFKCVITPFYVIKKYIEFNGKCWDVPWFKDHWMLNAVFLTFQIITLPKFT
jgi:hypothetical protein